MTKHAPHSSGSSSSPQKIRGWNGRRLPGLLLISAAVFCADRLAKEWAITHVALGSAVPVIPHLLSVSHWTNEGAAFSMFANSAPPHLVNHTLVEINCAIAAAILIALVFLSSRFSMLAVSLALILGGALGNVYDRIAYGAVIDFIEVQIFSFHFPDFNFADSSVVAGVVLLLLDPLLPGKHNRLRK